MNDKIEIIEPKTLIKPIIEELLNEDYIPEEDPERSVSNQEIIDGLEASIIKLEKLKGKKQIEQLVKTLILVCKILSVELNKSTFEDIGNINYVT